MIVERLETVRARGRQTVSAAIRSGQIEERLYYRWNGVAAPAPGDAILLIAMVLAMAASRDLVLRIPVSESYLKKLPEIQARLTCDRPGAPAIDVDTRDACVDPTNGVPAGNGSGDTTEGDGEGPRTGLVFTGDLDSYYALHRHLTDVDTLICLLGFPAGIGVGPNDDVLKTVRHPARALGKGLVVLESNLGALTERIGKDAWIDPNPTMAALGMILSGQVDRIYRPHNGAGSNGRAAGVFSATDLSLYTRRPIFLDDGGEGVGRESKIGALVEDDRFLDVVRVCWENPDRSYNCGRCPACSRAASAYQSLSSLN